MLIIKFGKYEGWKISTIPSSYLRWVRDNQTDKKLILACDAELEERRSKYSNHWKEGRVSCMGDVTLPVAFGKYKGKTIEEIPSSYLRWMTLNLDGKDDLIAGAETEIQYRTDHNKHFED